MSGPASAAAMAVIVPVLNEGAGLAGFLDRLAPDGFDEIVVVDNGSTDDSVSVASRYSGIRVITAPPGRGRALRAGACVTAAETLLFLHADTVLPGGAKAMIDVALRDPDVVGGCFRLSFDSEGAVLRLYAWFSRFDTAVTTFGDQALFVRREAYERVGGFPDWPILEDVELRRRLKSIGRFAKLPAAVVTSARRFRKHGAVWQQLRNAAIMTLFYLGLRPERIAIWYRPNSG